MLPVIDRFRPRLEAAGLEVIVADVNERLSEPELLGVIAEFDGVICGDDAFSDRVMAAAPRLRVISKWGTGIDSIDKDAAARRGIRVCNTPNAFTDSVADTAMGYMLMFARELATSDRDIREGVWEKRRVVALRETTLGIVGLGNIGRALAKRAAAFGMRILGTDIVEPPLAEIEAAGVRLCSLDDLLRESDFVSLHTDLNPTSHHLIDERTVALMKPTAYLINTSRGPVVSETALVGALERSAIAGAALDVFEDEPLPVASKLREYANCLLAPHNANGSPSAAERVHENTIANLLKALAEIPPRTEV
jgi:D-3-phosphoglycerate dehydrogenase